MPFPLVRLICPVGPVAGDLSVVPAHSVSSACLKEPQSSAPCFPQVGAKCPWQWRPVGLLPVGPSTVSVDSKSVAAVSPYASCLEPWPPGARGQARLWGAAWEPPVQQVTLSVSRPSAPRAWARCLTDLRWLRNQVIAPLTEELVFRACMLPMLAPCTGLGPAVLTCPLFFGVGESAQPAPGGSWCLGGPAGRQCGGTADMS